MDVDVVVVVNAFATNADDGRFVRLSPLPSHCLSIVVVVVVVVKRAIVVTQWLLSLLAPLEYAVQ